METEPDSLSLIIDNQLFLLVAIPSLEVVIGVLLIILLLICSALISGSEVAFFSLNANDLDDLKQGNGKGNQRILNLKETPRKLLATILIANNFINIAIVVISEFVIGKIFKDGGVFEDWSAAVLDSTALNISSESLAKGLQFTITIIGVTFLLVLFGEVAPKIYAKVNNVRLAKFMSRPLYVLTSIFHVPSTILVNWTGFIERKLERTSVSASITSREEIDEAIDLAVSTEKNTEREVDILKRIVKFGEVSVKQIMRSRVDVVAIDFRMTFRELLKVVRDSGYSRIPVYENDFDNVTGILYAKDLIGHLESGDDGFEWQELIRTDVLYVPEAKKIDDLLREFQKQRLHMAIVVDEYGGSAGIITLEDIMEEIIGEIKDEFDEDRDFSSIREVGENTYMIEGKTLLNDIYRGLHIPDDTFDEIRGDADSLAGLILELLGEMPKRNATVEYNDFEFKVVSVDKRRIKEIQVTIPAGVVLSGNS